MFKLLGSSVELDKGNEGARYFLGTIAFLLDGELKSINVEKDLNSVQIIDEGELRDKKVQGAALALGGVVLTGGIGLAAYFLRGKKIRTLLLQQSRRME